MLSTIDQTLTQLLGRHDNLFLDGVAQAVGTPLVWLPMLLLAVYVVIRSHSTTVGILQVLAGVSACLLCSELLSLFCRKLFMPETPMWLVPMDGARRYGLLSFITQDAMALAVWQLLLFRYRRLSVFLLLWALAVGWSQVYLGLCTALYVLSVSVVGAFSAYAVYAAYLRLSLKGSVVPSRRRGVRTQTGYGEDDARLLLLSGLSLCVVCAFCGLAQ